MSRPVVATGGIDHKHVEAVGRSRKHALGVARDEDALDTQTKADAGCWRAAKLFDQPVVAAAAARGVLGRLERGGFEFERGAGVVVEAAHERRVDVVGDARRVEARLAPA